MAFTIKDYMDLVKLLVEHPEWRSELRSLVLSEELLNLPEIVRQLVDAQRRGEERLTRLEETVTALAEAQRRTEERLSRLEETVAALAEAQRRTEERLSRLEETVTALAEAQRRTEKRLDRLEETVTALAEAQRRTEKRLDRLEETVAALVEAQRRLEETVAALAEAQRRTEEQIGELTIGVRDLAEGQRRLWDRLGRVEGRTLELEYREKAPAYFSRVLRRTRVIDRASLVDMLEEKLPLDELGDALLVDLVVSGRPRGIIDKERLFLAIEVSSVVDEGDVARARRRAGALRKAGYFAVPVVAGEDMTGEAELEAREQGVAILRDGRLSLWDEAISHLINSQTGGKRD